MKFLITGAAGFIGSHLTERLLNEGHSVIGIDNLDSFYSEELKRQNLRRALDSSRFEFIEGDISDVQQVKGLQREHLDVIVHLAAKAGVRPSLLDPSGYCRTNIEGTSNLLELARQSKVSRFIFASSSSVYGENPNRPWSESDENLIPISPYAASKLAGEQLGRIYSQIHGLQFVALRFFTVFGPRQRPDLAIRKFIELIKAAQKIPVFGDGSTSRDYTFVGDIVEGVRGAILASELPGFSIANLGQGRPITLSQMIETIGEVLGRVPEIERLPSQPGDVSHTLADISQAERLFGYSPSTTFEEGIRQLVAWQEEEQKTV